MKTSRIPEAGKGLFNVIRFRKKDHITFYSGKLIDRQDAKGLDPKYIKNIVGSLGLVCVGDSAFPGLYANGIHSKTRMPKVNARYAMEHIQIVSGSSLKGGIKYTVGMQIKFPLVATRDFDVDEEVIVDYRSDGYWSKNKEWANSIANNLYSAPSHYVGRNPTTQLYDYPLNQGLFCKRAIVAGTILPDFVGEIISVNEQIERIKAGRGGYFLKINKDTVLDCFEAKLEGSCLASCANSVHEDYPIRNIKTREQGENNVTLHAYNDIKKDCWRLYFKTITAITKDTEILADYEPYIKGMDDVGL